MNSLIVFDFDGTLVNINKLHKQAWREVIAATGLRGDLTQYLPPERFLLERFDSTERVKKNFLKNEIDKTTLEFFFNTDNKNDIAARLLDLKESYVLYLLEATSPIEMSKLYAKNIFQGLDLLLAEKNKLGIISNTHESIIINALRICRLDDCFEFVIGEESLYNQQGNPIQKQNKKAKDKIPQSTLKGSEGSCYYIGDDIRIDSLLARNYNFRFIQMTKEVDFMILKEYL